MNESLPRSLPAALIIQLSINTLLYKYLSIISQYATASTDSAAFFFGGLGVKVFGQSSSILSDIAEFSKLPGEVQPSWKHRGNLLTPRARPKVITYIDQTVIVGGKYMGVLADTRLVKIGS